MIAIILIISGITSAAIGVIIGILAASILGPTTVALVKLICALIALAFATAAVFTIWVNDGDERKGHDEQDGY